ncbi:MAG: hypothetical protein AB8C84_07610 [Oligoflexales bacterium]
MKLFICFLMSVFFLMESLGAQPGQDNRRDIEMYEMDFNGVYQDSSIPMPPVKKKSFSYGRPRYYVVGALAVTGLSLLSFGHYLQCFCNEGIAHDCVERRVGLPMMIIGGGFVSASIGRMSDLFSDYLEGS